MRPRSLLLAALFASPLSAGAETVLYRLDYPGLRAKGGAVPMTARISSDEGGTFDVFLELPTGHVVTKANVTIAAGGDATVPLKFFAPDREGVVDALIRVTNKTVLVESYPHRFVVDHAPVADSVIAASGIRGADGHALRTAKELADEFAPVLRLSTAGSLGLDERFLPKSIEAAFRSAKFERRHPVTARPYVFTAFRDTPGPFLGTNVGSDHFLDLVTRPFERDSSDEALALELKVQDVAQTAYATVVQADGVLSVQYWFYYLYNDWSNDHEADWEQVTVFFEGAAGQLKPTRVAGSRHQDGTWRMWSKTPKFVDLAGVPTQHPVAYVANGGHGNYFSSGVDFAGPLGNDNHDGSVIELVPNWLKSPREASLPMTVELVPRLSDRSDPATRWLAYSGRWGFWDGSTGFLTSGTQGPGGPAFRSGAGVTSARPAGEMWLWPKRWLEGGKGGEHLALDAEGDAFHNDHTQILTPKITGQNPAGLNVEATYRCDATGYDRLGNKVKPEFVKQRLVLEFGTQRQEVAGGVVRVTLSRGGELRVTCFAAEVELPVRDAYTSGFDTKVFSWCPANASVVKGQCTCKAGFASTDAAMTPCLAGNKKDDAGGTDDVPPAGSSGGCSATGGGAFALLTLVARRRRR